MTKHVAIGLVISSGLTLAGCQSTPQAVQQKEDLLSAAGFTPQPANTPQRLAAMKKLPPNKFVQQTHSQITYLYADPVVCQCVYFGNQAAYAQYRQLAFQQKLAGKRWMTQRWPKKVLTSARGTRRLCTEVKLSKNELLDFFRPMSA